MPAKKKAEKEKKPLNKPTPKKAVKKKPAATKSTLKSPTKKTPAKKSAKKSAPKKAVKTTAKKASAKKKTPKTVKNADAQEALRGGIDEAVNSQCPVGWRMQKWRELAEAKKIKVFFDRQAGKVVYSKELGALDIILRAMENISKIAGDYQPDEVKLSLGEETLNGILRGLPDSFAEGVREELARLVSARTSRKGGK